MNLNDFMANCPFCPNDISFDADSEKTIMCKTCRATWDVIYKVCDSCLQESCEDCERITDPKEHFPNLYVCSCGNAFHNPLNNQLNNEKLADIDLNKNRLVNNQNKFNNVNGEETSLSGMSFFDWLFGESKVGWLKTALLSGLFAIPIFFIVTSGDTGKLPHNKFIVIIIGYPFLLVSRSLYWSYRIKSYLEYANSETADESIVKNDFMSITKYNPKIWSELLAKVELIKALKNRINTSKE